METNEKLASWDNFISGNFLKTTNVTDDKQPFIVIEVAEFLDKRDNSTRVRLTVQSSPDQEFDFDLNKTNSIFLKNAGVKTPMGALGKKLYFKKVLVRNPKSNQEVESLRISKVE